jgi:hypothetical protein
MLRTQDQTIGFQNGGHGMGHVRDAPVVVFALLEPPAGVFLAKMQALFLFPKA